MAKIAVQLEGALADKARHGVAGRATPRVLAGGEGWSVADVVCTRGPRDLPFEERHATVCVAVVVSGTFQYRGASPGAGRTAELMTPGSVLLGNAGQCFECGHEHGEGDRCVSFHFAPEYFERVAGDGAGTDVALPPDRPFPVLCLPPLRELAPSVARAAALSRARMRWRGRRSACAWPAPRCEWRRALRRTGATRQFPPAPKRG